MSIVPLEHWLAHRPRRGATVIDTIVLHFVETGDRDELLRSLKQSDHSYHYILDLDGTIVKCVPYSAVAFHCGNSFGPHEAARGVSCQRDSTGAFVEHPCVNDYTIGICFMHESDEFDVVAFSQIEACQRLITELKKPLPKLRYITTHPQVSPGRVSYSIGLDLLHFANSVDLEVWSTDGIQSRSADKAQEVR